ncbi:MAG: citramalate synthase, partial [Planctomycetaceae bacterium]
MRRIEIYDTTLRDGSQGEGVNFSLEDKLAITQRLDAAGVDFIEGGYPLSNPKDAQYFVRVQELMFAHSRVVAFGMTRRRGMSAAEDPGMRALLEAQTSVITIVGKTSAFHVTEVLGVTLEENLAMIYDTVSHLVSSGREVFYDAEHFFDGWKLDPEYSRQTILAAERAGASRVVLCDTNGGTLPLEVSTMVAQACACLKIPVGIHCHNDCDLAIANSLFAVSAGASQVQGTINGLGERCGNADLISVVANLAIKSNGHEILSGSGTKHLTELSRFVYE